MRLFACLLMMCAVAAAEKPKVLRVDAAGKGDYTTVQAAVDHALERGAVIAIAPGLYREKLNIAKANMHLVGLGAKPEDVVLTWDDSAGTAGGTSKSASVTALGDGFEVENLTIANTWENEHDRTGQGAQAVALLLTGDRDVLDRVRLLGAQDTLYANSRLCRDLAIAEAHRSCMAARQYFRDCYVEGHVDFIFGDAKAVFDHCELHPRQHAQVMLTAQSKYYPEEDSGYYFLGCSVTGKTDGRQIYFGRPWREYAAVWFVDTQIEPTMAATGWSEWGGRLKTSAYREYGSRGPGVNGGHRVVVSPKLTTEQRAALMPQVLLRGADGWDAVAALLALRDELEHLSPK